MIWTTGQLPCLAYRAMLASFLNKIIFSLGCVGKKEIVPNPSKCDSKRSFPNLQSNTKKIITSSLNQAKEAVQILNTFTLQHDTQL